MNEIWGWEDRAQRRMFSGRFARRPRQVIELRQRACGVLEMEDRPDELYLALLELSPQSSKPLALHVLRADCVPVSGCRIAVWCGARLAFGRASRQPWVM